MSSAVSKAAFRPTWEGQIEAWSRNYIFKNLWKVSPGMEYNDLYQEFYLLFMRVKGHYTNVTAPHFMRLYQSTVRNRVIDLARAKRRTMGEAMGGLMEMAALEETAAAAPSTSVQVLNSEFDAFMRDLPQEMASLVQVILDKYEAGALVCREGNSLRAINRRLCKLVGKRSKARLGYRLLKLLELEQAPATT